MSATREDAIEAGWLVWCFVEGYGLPEDREGVTNWLREPDERLHPDDVRSKAQLLALGRDLVDAIEAEVRERIAQAIEAQPIDAWGSQEPRGPVSFARAEAFVRAARIARGDTPTRDQ